MKKIHILYFLIVLIGLSACQKKVTVETAENFQQVELPDSSVVYLNYNSKLPYNEKFNPRRVTLEGEAFFSVNDGATPFIIETEEGEEVTVLGTEFNLIASSKGMALEVEIGSVSIRIGNIFKEVRRGQRIDYSRHDNGLHLGQAKNGHRKWIGVMDKDFRKSGKFLKRSNKHASKNIFKPGGGLKKKKQSNSNQKPTQKTKGKTGGNKKTDTAKGSKGGKDKKGKN
jgi:hypothetical protein